MSVFKEFSFDEIDFQINSSQQFATVIFDRSEDAISADITVIRDGKINQFTGDNRFNPSARRHASCVYVEEEGGGKYIKICTIQHKGITLVEVYGVSQDEVDYLLNVQE